MELSRSFLCSRQGCSLESRALTCTWPSSCDLQRRSCPGTPFYMNVMNISVFLAVPEIKDGDKMIVMLMIMKGEQDHPCLLNLQFKKPKGKIQNVSVTPMG